MADTDTYIVSLALYQYLCEHIVGSENHVKTIRQLNIVRDNVSGSKHVTITSGSFGEGLEMRGSDLDMMYVCTAIEIYEDEKTRLNSNKANYRMETDDVKPGYTQLLLEKNNITTCPEFNEELNGHRYLSSAIFKHFCLYVVGNYAIIHGPCISDEKINLDIAFCLHCKTWISQASEWIFRANNSWPSYNVKQTIIKHGVLFVAVGVKGSPKEDIEWRISFSVGEKLLISTFTHTQLLCYALLKILLKDVIATYTECSNLLCSYFVKTIIFWISEEIPQSVWKPKNLIPCFMRCLNRLIYCVTYSTCLHYFIPENNMFENKIEGRAREILLDKLYTLHSYGWRCVLFSDQLFSFHVSSLDHVGPHMFPIEVAKSLHSKNLNNTNVLNECHPELEMYVYKRRIHQIVFCNQSSKKHVYTYYMSLWCARYAQTISLNSTSFKINKHQYKQYNSCFCTLLQNFHHDAVSGWLMVASFFYKTKQYNKALHILVYSITKCTPEKIYSFMGMSSIHYYLLKSLKSFREKSIVRLWKILFVDFIKFERSSSLIPYELQMEVENETCLIPSIVYAYFLKFLCHYHLNDVRQCQACIHTLQHVIAENYLIGEVASLKSRAYNILGIALQLSGDNAAARQAFMQSVDIWADPRFNKSIKRLSLLNSL